MDPLRIRTPNKVPLISEAPACDDHATDTGSKKTAADRINVSEREGPLHSVA